MSRGGFAGKTLLIDLTKNEIKQEPLDFDLAEQFIGGLGLTLKLAYDHITPGTDALAPENVIVLGAGPLVGTDIPSTSRVFAVSKLPSSGTIGWCGAGSVNFGCELKNAGFDHIIIKGKAAYPVYLKISDNTVEVCDAKHLWGLGVTETCQEIWKDSDHQSGIISIGPAGEKQVSFSMAFINRIATLGRGGLGAVFGSKNLKAVVVAGNQGIAVADRKTYKELNKTFSQQIKDYPYLKEWQKMGMLKSFPVIPKELHQRLIKRHVACVSCPFGCKDIVEIPDGKFKGQVVCSSSIINLFTPNIYGIGDYDESIRLVSVLDKLGLDAFEFFGVMNYAKALGEQGIISVDDISPAIQFESLSSLETWAGKISRREGLGDVLADGFKGILAVFGEEAKQYAPALIKGMHPYAGPGSALPWSLFGTMELGQVLDPRGPHVGSGGSPTYFAKRPLDVFYKHLNRMGVPQDAIDRIIIDKNDSDEHDKKLKVGTLLKYSHGWFSILGSMGICARAQVNRFYDANICARFYEAVTGIKTDLLQLRERVDRVWTLYRQMNLRENFKRNIHESLPEQWFKNGGFSEYVSEQPLSKSDAEEMMEDYYEEWGWDRQTGVPTQEGLEKLGLSEH